MINTNLHSISYYFEVIADYGSILDEKRSLCVLSPSPPLPLIGKLVVDFLFVFELFSIGVTAEAIRANKTSLMIFSIGNFALGYQ